MTKIHRGPNGIRLEIDTSDSATPAMVYCGKSSGTFDCANDTGELCTSDEFYQLTDAQAAWLDKFTNEVQAAFEIARPDGWDR